MLQLDECEFIHRNGSFPNWWRVSSRERRRSILSFDVEEHHRIEAAAGLEIAPELKAHYGERVGPVDALAAGSARRGTASRRPSSSSAQIAEDDPGLVREIHEAGHEVASHGWDHRRVLDA